MQNKALLLIIGLLAGASGTALAASSSCAGKSGNFTTALLELYTSEGCSSCPPADQWLTGLRSSGLTASQVVPLALHVDYWNDLGWEDPFSQKRFTLRQYALAKISKQRTVYTPQVILSGRDLPRWRNSAETSIRRINAKPPRAHVALQLSRHANQVNVTADANAKDPRGQAEMYVALYENNLTGRIEAGENRGLTLRHDYVVRRLLGPTPLDKSGAAHDAPQIVLDASWKQDDLGVAVFVQDRDSGEILQALALPLCR
jgi:hypothetical protein